MWDDPADDDTVVSWARSSFSSFSPWATGGVYTNFAGFDDERDVTTADRLGSDPRLEGVRTTYDPDGLFAGAVARP
jgi:hypothetical protein